MNFKKIKENKINSGLTCVIVIFASVLVALFCMSVMMIKDMSFEVQNLDARKKLLAVKERDYNGYESNLNEYTGLYDLYESISESLNVHTSTADILAGINLIAEKYKLEETYFRAGSVVDVSHSDEEQQTDVLKEASRIQANITYTGELSNMIGYLDELYDGLINVSISKVTLTPRDDGMEMKITLSFYVVMI